MNGHCSNSLTHTPLARLPPPRPSCAVARFGDREHAERTLFATLHDLSAVFESHQQLDQQKPPEKGKGPPFVVRPTRTLGNCATVCVMHPLHVVLHDLRMLQ